MRRDGRGRRLRRPSYRIRDKSGGEQVLDWRSIMHVRPFSVAPDDVVSIVQEIRETIALELIMIRHQGALFANGARPWAS